MYSQALLRQPRSPQVEALRHDASVFFDPYFEDKACRRDTFYLSEEGVVADMAAPMYLPENDGSCVRDVARYTVVPIRTHEIRRRARS